MSYMKRQLEQMQHHVTDFRAWHRIDTELGIFYFPFKKSSENVAKTLSRSAKHEVVHGYGARLDACDMLQSTEWVIFDTRQEAKDYLVRMYGDYSIDDGVMPKICEVGDEQNERR